MELNDDSKQKNNPSSIELYDDIFEKIRLVADEKKISTSDVVRIATRKFLEHLKDFVDPNELPNRTSEKPKKINVRFSIEEKKDAKIIEEEFEMSFSTIVRIGIILYLKKELEGMNDAKENPCDIKLQQE